MNPKVDEYLSKATQWQKETALLRTILLGAGLTEDFKWGKPCYTFEGANVVIVAGMKEHCALIFAKGALLANEHGLLVQPGENSQSARQMRFTSSADIAEKEEPLKRSLQEAIAAEKAGLQVEYKDISEREVPAEFQQKLDQSAELRAAYEALTPGRRRQYLMHFSAAKQAKTREARVEKCIPQILAGKGLSD